MGVETIVRATEDRQMATPLTNILRCEAEGGGSVAHYHRRRDVGGINGMEAFHVVCKEVKATVSAGKVVATVFCGMQGSFRRCHAAWWGGDCSGISDDVTTPEEKVRRRRSGEVATA